jgi:hypothetical protein
MNESSSSRSARVDQFNAVWVVSRIHKYHTPEAKYQKQLDKTITISAPLGP